MLIINIPIILFFIVLGILLKKGKGVNLISGYNTMPKEEKDKVDTKLLCKYVSTLMFILSVCWLVLSIGLELEFMWLFWGGLGLSTAVIIFFLIFLNTGNRIQKKD